MAIRFICQCGKKLKAPDEKIGKKVLCSTCGATLVVPESDTTTVETVTMEEKPGSVANLAGDLLKRTVAESKKRNAGPQEVYDDSGIDVAELLQRRLFNEVDTVVMTSATLAVEGRFDYIQGRLGVPEARELIVPPHFDYANQVLFYVPPALPDTMVAVLR